MTAPEISDSGALSAAERRRLAEVFGEEGPNQSSDDLPDAGEASSRDDAWWQAQRPPHHGG